MTAKAHEPHIGIVVEGRGDLFAVPVLLRKWLSLKEDWRDLLGKPVPCHGRDKALVPQGIEGYVATAACRPGCVGVLVILDAEDDPACALGPTLLARVSSVTGKPVAVCLAEDRYEAWLLASAETLEIDGLQYDPTRNPEALLREALPAKYVKPTWQPRLSDRLDFDLALPRSASLSRMLEKFDRLLEKV